MRLHPSATTRLARAPRPRRGISLLEIVIAMTLLAFVIGSLGLMSTKNAVRGRTLAKTSARTFVLMQQSNRFSVLPYDSIPNYAPRTDTVIANRDSFIRHVTYVQGTTGSEYRTVKVLLQPVGDLAKRDSLLFLRAKTYDHTPLFTQ